MGAADVIQVIAASTLVFPNRTPWPDIRVLTFVWDQPPPYTRPAVPAVEGRGKASPWSPPPHAGFYKPPGSGADHPAREPYGWRRAADT